jgi:hypothetical protein
MNSNVQLRKALILANNKIISYFPSSAQGTGQGCAGTLPHIFHSTFALYIIGRSAPTLFALCPAMHLAIACLCLYRHETTVRSRGHGFLAFRAELTLQSNGLRSKSCVFCGLGDYNFRSPYPGLLNSAISSASCFLHTLILCCYTLLKCLHACRVLGVSTFRVYDLR